MLKKLYVSSAFIPVSEFRDFTIDDPALSSSEDDRVCAGASQSSRKQKGEKTTRCRHRDMRSVKIAIALAINVLKGFPRINYHPKF